MRKQKYQVKHDLIRSLPKELWELGDSAYDHLGEIIAKIDPLEALGFYLGINFILELTEVTEAELNWKYLLAGGITGALAVRGLQTKSEAVGIASIATLAMMGAIWVSPDIETQAKEKIRKIRATKEAFYEFLGGK